MWFTANPAAISSLQIVLNMYNDNVNNPNPDLPISISLFLKPQYYLIILLILYYCSTLTSLISHLSKLQLKLWNFGQGIENPVMSAATKVIFVGRCQYRSDRLINTMTHCKLQDHFVLFNFTVTASWCS